MIFCFDSEVQKETRFKEKLLPKIRNNLPNKIFMQPNDTPPNSRGDLSNQMLILVKIAQQQASGNKLIPNVQFICNAVCYFI